MFIKRRFAGARGAHDGDEFTLMDGQRDAVQHLDRKIAAGHIGLAHVAEVDQGRSDCARCRWGPSWAARFMIGPKPSSCRA